jgi:hypothetical protein
MRAAWHLLATAMLVGACGQSRPAHGDTAVQRVAAADSDSAWSYSGANARGIPHYTTRAFTPAERQLLRTVYGIEDPNRLYVSDSTDDGLLKYDTKQKTCRDCLVDSYDVGFVSVRRPGESWEEVERRVRAMHPRDFSALAHHGSVSTAALDPDVRPVVERMLADAQRAGFHFHVTATYRAPEREAYLMSLGRGRTYTLTSMHTYGRAIDIVIGDGRLRHAATRREWIAFRRWVTQYDHGTFRVLGTPADTWDWPHVEIPGDSLGFHTLDDALARARRCGGGPACNFQPHLPAGVDST